MRKIDTVLFDLDGTLLDTAPDMALALNMLRNQHGLADLPLSVIRPSVGYGSRALLKLGFNIDETHEKYPKLLEEFFAAYDKCLALSTALFPEMSSVLSHFDEKNIPWGIVTNKPARFTHGLLDALDLTQRCAVIICGDTLNNRKPHPEPILHACKLLQRAPETTLYIGDTITDVQASKAAGTRSLVALYGYIGAEEDPYTWEADGYIEKAGEIIPWI